MAGSYGWIRVSKGRKVKHCSRGKYCELGGVLDSGVYRASITSWRRVSRSASPTDREFEAGETSERGKVEYAASVGRSINQVRYYHIECMTPWLLHEAEYQESNAKPRGRPVGSIQYTPAENKLRRKLIDRRKYLLRKLATEDDLVLGAGLITEAALLSKALGKPSKISRPGLGRRVQALVCTAGDYCRPDPLGHCSNCGDCLQALCVCIRPRRVMVI